MNSVSKNSKMIFIVCDVNDTDYVTFKSVYSEEKIKKLKILNNLTKHDLEELIEDLDICSHQDIWPHTINKYYVVDIIDEGLVDFRMSDYN